MVDLKFYTYLYVDPRTHIPRYAGKGHGSRWKSKNHPNKQFNGWLKNLHEAGFAPIIEITYTTNEVAAHWLERCMIAAYGRIDKQTGTLFNHTDGGEGVSGWIWTEDRKNKIRGNQYAKGNTFKMSPEYCAKKSQSLIGNKHSIGNKNCVGRKLSAETRAKISASCKGRIGPGKNLKPQQITCACGKTGGISIMKRWHMNNCKLIS